MIKIGYIDTSFLLSIIFEDENYELSIDIWNDIEFKYGSVLLEIEARINLYKYFIKLKNDDVRYLDKQKELTPLMDSIVKKVMDNEINLEIKNNDKLKRTRSLDSVHLATAHIINKLTDEKVVVCSYDKEMIKGAKALGLGVIRVS